MNCGLFELEKEGNEKESFGLFMYYMKMSCVGPSELLTNQPSWLNHFVMLSGKF